MNLDNIEKELNDLIQKDKKNWTHFYLLLKEVETKELWRDSFRSFTAWVKDFCLKTKTHESIVWSRKKAGEVYQNYVKVQAEKGIEVKEITKIDVAQDTLVLLDKISRQAPDLGAELTEKALNRDIRKKDLLEAYKSIKAFKNRETNKGIDKYNDKDINKEVDKENNKCNDKVNVTATEILTALYDTKWLGVEKKKKHFKTTFEQDKYCVFSEFPVHTGTSQKSRRIDAFVSENMSTQNPWELNLHAIEIKVSKSDLLNDSKYTEYAEFVDYIWLAIPKHLIEDVKNTKPNGCGIIVIEDKKAKVIEKAGKMDALRKQETLTTLALKLL